MKIEHLDNSSEVRTALGICTPEPKGLSETKLRNSAAANPIRTDEPKLRPTQAVSVRTNANSRERSQTPAPASYFRTDELKPSGIHTPIRESETKLQPQQAISARTNPNRQPSTRQFARAKPNSSPSKPVPHERTQTIRHPYANSRERSQTPVQQATSTRTNPNIRRPHTDSRERTQTPAPASHFRSDEPKLSGIHTPIRESEAKLQSSKPFPHGRTQTIRRPRTNSRERTQTPVPASRFRTDAPKPSAIHASIHESEPKLQPSKPFPHGRTQTIRRPRTNSRERSQTPAQQAIPARTNPNHQASIRQLARAKPNSSPASHSRTDELKPSAIHTPIRESEAKLQPPASHFRTDEPKHQASAIPIHTSEAIIGRQ
jgi:hypothetical protein